VGELRRLRDKTAARGGIAEGRRLLRLARRRHAVRDADAAALDHAAEAARSVEWAPLLDAWGLRAPHHDTGGDGGDVEQHGDSDGAQGGDGGDVEPGAEAG